MFQKKLALILLYDSKKRILLQDRRNMSKYGEDWGYFGGKIEEGESSRVAICREVKEELEFELKSPVYLAQYVTVGRHIKKKEEHRIIQEVFLKKISSRDYDSMKLHEGAGMKWFSLSEIKKLNMKPLDPKIIDDFSKKMS